MVRFPPPEEDVGIVGEPVDPVSVVPDADLVDPAAEVGGRGHVGADGDDAGGDLRRLAGQVDEDAAERLLGGEAGGGVAGEVGRDRGGGGGGGGGGGPPRRGP